MLKVVRNRGILDKVAKRFPAVFFSKASVVIVLIVSIFTMGLLFYEAYLVIYIPPSSAPSLAYEIGLPGINPAIPVGYGIAALAFAGVIHEMFHGIVARKHGIKVSSVGVLFFIVPMGAFVEPDEKEIQEVDPVKRRRLIAAGPGVNIVIGVITFLVLALVLMPAATPIHNGLYVQDVTSSSFTANYAVSGTELISFGNYTGNQVNNLSLNAQLTPGLLYNATFFNGNSVVTHQLPAGLTINSVTPGTAAANASLQAGQTIVSVDGLLVHNDTELANILDAIPPGTNITVVMESYTLVSNAPQGHLVTANVTTMSKYAYYEQNYPSLNSPSYRNESFLGITIAYSGMLGENLSLLHYTLSGQEVFSNPWVGGLSFIILPFYYLYPVSTGLAALFSVPFYAPLFWVLVNLMYWLFWMDVLLGSTNALPILIFDGAQFLRDTLLIAGKRDRFKYLRDEKNVSKVVSIASAIMIGLLLWTLIIPRVI